MNEKLRRIITALTCTALAAAMLAGWTAPVNTAEPEVTPDIIVTAEPYRGPCRDCTRPDNACRNSERGDG